jgi:predicted kinase
MKNVLYILRGLSGAGKTAVASRLAATRCSADDWFYDEHGNYNFDPKFLKEAHASCQEKCREMLEASMPWVVVDNTFSTRWEMEPYFKMAQENGYNVSVISLWDGGLDDEELAARNSHGVPKETIRNMRARWEFDWKSGDPRPPWGR